ncbi:MAG: hypothetical protein ACFFFH_20970, partial [Candidatus Thorarchaeota archaeon]
MGTCKRIGVIVGLILLLGINLSLIKGFYPGCGFKHSENLNFLALTNQDGSELIPDNSTWRDYPIDDDLNGYYDRLIVNLGPPKTLNQEFGIYGILNDSKGNLLGISRLYPWDITSEILLSFQGQPININGENGPYHVWIGTFRYNWWSIDDLQMLYSYNTTFDYNPEDFESPRAKITEISDYGNDTDNDEIIDEIILNFTVEIKDPGEYNLAMSLESSIPFAGLMQEFNWGGFLTPEDTSIVMRINFRDNDFHGSLNVSYIKFELYGIVMQFLTKIYTTNSYFTEYPHTYARLTGKYWDWGLDANLNGKFDQLVITAEVNITLAGYYSLNMHLTTTNSEQGVWDEWANHYTYLNEALLNISFYFDASLLYSHRNDFSFEIEYISIRDEHFNLMYEISCPYTTRVYNYFEFDIPKAFLTGNFWNWGVDTNFDGKFDQLAITVEINVTFIGTYLLQLNVHPFGTDRGDWDQYTEVRQYWSVGVRNVSVFIDAIQFYSLRNDTSFELEYVRIREWDDYNEIDYCSYPYLTRIYNYSEFDFPDATFTGNYRIRGVDSEADSRFELLAFDIQINVTKDNNYEIQIEVRSVNGDFHKWWSQEEFFEEGKYWLTF